MKWDTLIWYNLRLECERLCRRYGLPIHVAEDIALEAEANAFSRLYSYQIGRGFERWLFGIARNCSRSKRKIHRDDIALEALGPDAEGERRSQPHPREMPAPVWF